MSTDLRALCAELVDDLEEWVDGFLINDPADQHTDASFALIDRARAALAEPLPAADGEVAELVAVLRYDAECIDAEYYKGCAMTAAQCYRAAELLERLSATGKPVLQVEPIPVSERLPEAWDCTGDGCCWVWNFTAYTWGVFRLDPSAHSHWLPAHALPLPKEVE